MKTIQIIDYINVDSMIEEIVEILKGELESIRNDENSSIIDTEFHEKYIEEYAFELAIEYNDDIKKYLHYKDHRIDSNFKNIDYDYNYHINGEVEFNTPLLKEMIERLDNNEQSERAQSDRNFLTDWFLETFGTFAISYNFGELVSETLNEK